MKKDGIIASHVRCNRQPVGEYAIFSMDRCKDHDFASAFLSKGEFMSRNIIVVNAGPRNGRNTDTLISEAMRGAKSCGAQVQRFDLFRLEKFTGCISCFGCKREKNKGRCVCRDGLTEVIDAISESDGLIIGSPNYLGELTASFRALYERLVFRSLTYNIETPCCNIRPVPVLLIMTSNAPDTAYAALLQNYKQVLSRFVGPTEILVSGDTLQLDDYSKTDWEWSMFDPEAKMKRHEEIFPQECERAFEMGAKLAGGGR